MNKKIGLAGLAMLALGSISLAFVQQQQRITVIENIGNNPGGTYIVPPNKTLTVTHLGTNDPNSQGISYAWVLYTSPPGGGAFLASVDNAATPGIVALATPVTVQAGDHLYLFGGGGGNYDCVAKGVLQ